jgi:hypothetical protein
MVEHDVTTIWPSCRPASSQSYWREFLFDVCTSYHDETDMMEGGVVDRAGGMAAALVCNG